MSIVFYFCKMSSRSCRIYAAENYILTIEDQNLSHSQTTVFVLFFQWLQMHAKLNDPRSHLNNKKIAHSFDFLHLHRMVPVKNLWLRMRMYG